MFDRAATGIITTAAAGAAAALTVFAAGFAVFAALAPEFGPAGAAALVALIAAVLTALYAFIVAQRAKRRELEAAAAQADLINTLPRGVESLAREHPLAALAASLIGGVVAARHPTLARDLVSLAARFGAR